jgi:hypothetical protein
MDNQQQMISGFNPQLGAKPAFTLTPMTRKQKKTICKRDDNGFEMTEVEVEVDGFLVHTPKGNSTFLTLKELRRRKMDTMIPYINDLGDVLAMQPITLNKKGE